MTEGAERGRRPAILIATLKTVVVVGALSYLSATWVAGGFDRAALGRLAARGGEIDVATTGSLGRAAEGTRLDPCVVPARR